MPDRLRQAITVLQTRFGSAAPRPAAPPCPARSSGIPELDALTGIGGGAGGRVCVLAGGRGSGGEGLGAGGAGGRGPSTGGRGEARRPAAGSAGRPRRPPRAFASQFFEPLTCGVWPS